VVNFRVDVGSYVVFNILVASGGHGEGKTWEEVEKRGGGKGKVFPWKEKDKK
jgi:hypothetical protein